VEENYHNIYRDIPFYSRFLTVDEIDNLITLITKLPGVECKNIGTTVTNEPLHMITIGEGEKTALIIGVPHSDEPLGSLVITFFARWLAIHPEIGNFGWKWMFIPILERHGMRLNEGWFNMPHSFAVTDPCHAIPNRTLSEYLLKSLFSAATQALGVFVGIPPHMADTDLFAIPCIWSGVVAMRSSELLWRGLRLPFP